MKTDDLQEKITAQNGRIWAQIDLDAIRFNMESMHASTAPGTPIIAVLKTNAYGHGALSIATELEKIPYVWGYAVATFEEAAALREGGAAKPILLLGYVFPYCYGQLGPLDIRPAVFRPDMLRQLSGAARAAGSEIRVHIAVDTGMTRIGITPDEEGLSFVGQVLAAEGIILEGMFTHFARADETDRSHTDLQLKRFRDFEAAVRERTGYRIPMVHASNSAGIISFTEANLNAVRAGITLYGLWPSPDVPKDIVPLRPVMSLYSRVVYVKDVPAGTPVSYGGTYVTSGSATRIATVPAGYGDGYPRALSGKGYVLIRGKRAPILGRICMDQMMVDVTDIPDVRENEVVTLIGRDGEAEITMETLGDLSGRFNYELACDINQRVPRVFVNG